MPVLAAARRPQGLAGAGHSGRSLYDLPPFAGPGSAVAAPGPVGTGFV